MWLWQYLSHTNIFMTSVKDVSLKNSSCGLSRKEAVWRKNQEMRMMMLFPQFYFLCDLRLSCLLFMLLFSVCVEAENETTVFSLLCVAFMCYMWSDPTEIYTNNCMNGWIDWIICKLEKGMKKAKDEMKKNKGGEWNYLTYLHYLFWNGDSFQENLYSENRIIHTYHCCFLYMLDFVKCQDV